MREMSNAYKLFVSKPEGKIPFGRPRRRWEVNITIDVKVGSCGLASSSSG
jgi:hypothetical protein